MSFFQTIWVVYFLCQELFWYLRGPVIWRRRADYSSSSTICQGFFSHREKIFQKRSLLRRADYTVVRRRCQEKFAPSVKKIFWRSLPQACPCPTLVLYGQRGARVKRSFADFAAVLPSFLRPGALLARKVKKKFCENLGKFLLTFGPNEPAPDKNYDFFRVCGVKVVDKLRFSIYNVYIK